MPTDIETLADYFILFICGWVIGFYVGKLLKGLYDTLRSYQNGSRQD
jgi:hypothetical protein